MSAARLGVPITQREKLGGAPTRPVCLRTADARRACGRAAPHDGPGRRDPSRSRPGPTAGGFARARRAPRKAGASLDADCGVEACAPDCALEGADDAVGVVVGAGDVGRLAVAPEGDRARTGRPEVRAGLLQVGVGREPELAGVLGGSEHELADEVDRRRMGGVS